jgi:hypothetical protein
VLAAIMAAILYGAVLVCAYGFISLFSGRDVIRQPDVGLLVGPVMVFVACALVFVSALLSLRPRGDVFSALLFFADNVTGPFVIVSGIVAIPVLLATPLLAGISKGAG